MTTSLKVIHDQLFDIEHVVVCIDPVDLDNIWLCLWALVRIPNAKVHIVLSPRVLDPRVPSFGDLFGELIKKLGPCYMLDVLEKDAEEIYEQLGYESLQVCFARDSTFQDDLNTQEHIPLYMYGSALRILAKIRSKGHPKSRIDMSYDPRSMDTIVPGIHHPTHVLDMLYACNQEERQEAVEAMALRGLGREEGLVAVMEKTAKRLARELGYQKMAKVLRPFDEIVSLFNGDAATSRTIILGGGPFTEMRRLLTDTALVPVAFVAMARTWFADVNIFPNN